MTLRRSKKIKQSVEYFYLQNKYNALILNNISDFNKVLDLPQNKLEQMSDNAFETYTKNLQLNIMVNKFKSHLNV